MRKLFISCGLTLLLLMAQLGAVFHEVGHISRVGANIHAQVHSDTTLEKTCELCLAYSQVLNPVSNSLEWSLFEPASYAVASQLPGSTPSAEALSPRSRGPPTTT